MARKGEGKKTKQKKNTCGIYCTTVSEANCTFGAAQRAGEGGDGRGGGGRERGVGEKERIQMGRFVSPKFKTIIHGMHISLDKSKL